MRDDLSQYVYSADDIHEAYDMGIKTALRIFEETGDISQEGRQLLIESMRKMISK